MQWIEKKIEIILKFIIIIISAKQLKLGFFNMIGWIYLNPKNPFNNPLIPWACPCAFDSFLSSRVGNSMWFNARSKYNGLHWIGVNCGGILATFWSFAIEFESFDCLNRE